MKQINHKKLTSNELVNKILVANLSENDTIYTKLPMLGMTDRRCFDVVLEEFHKNVLRKKNVILFLTNIFTYMIRSRVWMRLT